MVRELDNDYLSDIKTLLTADAARSLGLIAPRGRTRGLLTTATAVIPIPAGTKAVKLYASTLARVGASASGTPVTATQEKQTITAGDATSGNFTLGFQSQTTGNIAWNSSAANLVTAGVAISSIGTAGITATGGPLNTTPIVVTFAAGILDGDQPMLVPTTVDLAGGVSAGSRLPVVTQSTPAVNVSGFIEAGSEFIFAVVSTDAYLHLTADSGTGLYRISWIS